MRCFIYPALVAATVLGASARSDDFDANTAPVGRTAAGLVTPVNQLVTPAGTQVDLPGMRPQALALSPDGKLLVTAGLTHELLVLDPATGKIVQHVDFPSDAAKPAKAVSAEILSPDDKAQLSFTGLTFSPAGTRIYLANVNGDVKVFGVNQTNGVTPLFSMALPGSASPSRSAEIPAGIAVSADGILFFADVGNNCIRKIAPNGIITTVKDFSPAQAYGSLALQSDGTLYTSVTDGGIWKMTPDGTWSLSTAAQGNLELASGPSGILYWSGGLLQEQVFSFPGNFLVAG